MMQAEDGLAGTANYMGVGGRLEVRPRNVLRNICEPFKGESPSNVLRMQSPG